MPDVTNMATALGIRIELQIKYVASVMVVQKHERRNKRGKLHAVIKIFGTSY